MTILVAIYSQFGGWCIPPIELEGLRRDFPEHTFVRADSDDEVLQRIPGADIVFGTRVTPAQLAAASRLKWIHSPAAGIGNMLFPEMVEAAVPMTNSRGNSAATMAEHIIAVTLVLMRRLPLAWRRQRQAVWAHDDFDAGASTRTLRGSRVLIVGLGAIGGEAGRLAAAFGAHVVGIRRRANGPPSEGVSAILTADRLDAELPHADVVVLAAPQLAETTHLIGERELSLMKDHAVLVNVSRGALVDEPALLRALEGGRLGGAALDVFEQEPLPPNSPFWGRQDVVVTPHVSGYHAHYWRDATGIFAENLRRFMAGQPLVNRVDKKAGY